MFALQGILVFIHDHFTQLQEFSFIYKYECIYVSICMCKPQVISDLKDHNLMKYFSPLG